MLRKTLSKILHFRKLVISRQIWVGMKLKGIPVTTIKVRRVSKIEAQFFRRLEAKKILDQLMPTLPKSKFTIIKLFLTSLTRSRILE